MSGIVSLRRFWKSPVYKAHAKVAQLVEHDLAKVGVAGSSPVSRSIPLRRGFCSLPGWWNW